MRSLLRLQGHACILGWLLIIPTSATPQNFTGGYNFVFPASDTSTARFLPSFPKKPIGPEDFVAIDGSGHFAIQSSPVRFFGTNCVADGAFPLPAQDWFIAGRLRKMGYNLVRLHLMDNPWSSNGSLFIQGTDTRHLNPVTLDRLDHFLAELKANGIYVDVNLHVGRTFMRSDGVPDADSLKDYAKGYTYFDPLLIFLQKEFASQLLTHVSPYTGLSLAADPVMGLVEITNENSLYALWRNGVLKPYSAGGILPVRHEHLLDSLWSSFLHESYANTEALSSSWNSGAMAEGPELTTNGSYEDVVFPGFWTLEQHSPASGAFTRILGNVYEGVLAVKVSVSASDGVDWHLQWKETGLSLARDSIYVVRFAARSDSTRTIGAWVTKDVSPYTSYGGVQATLDTTWREFKFLLRASETSSNNVRLSFSVGAEQGVYWFDAVSMKRAASSGLLSGESLEQTPRRIDYSECAGFTDGRARDMTAFYLKIESDFFALMRAYLHDTLGVRVPIVGTNWNFGLPDLAVQAGLDYIDNHAYWDHPAFPGIPWSATDWTIVNSPMVLQPSASTVGRLFGGVPQLGKPYTVSEYNHPFPNRYQSEGELFLTAYAAFHSADAVMFFDYNGSTDWTTDFIASYFDMHRNSAQLALMPTLGAVFRGGMVAPAVQTLALRFTRDDVLLTPKRDPGGWESIAVVSPSLPLLHAVRTESFDETSSSGTPIPGNPGSPYLSDTGELCWDSTGIFSVRSPDFNAATGFLEDFAGMTIGDLGIVSSSDHATITWLSLDTLPLAFSRRSLLTVATRGENTGMVWDGIHTIHNNWGGPPTSLSPLRALLTLHLHADSLRVFLLDPFGGEGGGSRVLFPADTNTFRLTVDGTIDKTPWYGIQAMGSGTVSSLREGGGEPLRFILEQNYPNPFNPVTTVRYVLPARTHVRFTVFNPLGQRVAVLLNAEQEGGVHELRFDGSGLSSGVYFYRLQAGAFVATKKMLVLR
jgi:hypothetical protein